jgi:hypothetical protein
MRGFFTLFRMTAYEYVDTSRLSELCQVALGGLIGGV